MERNEFERLLNRELDGLLSPEEEARLNDFTARDPEAAEEQRSHHAIHRAFQEMEAESVPEGLADRIADRVTSGPATVHQLKRPPAWSRIAAGLLVIAAIALGGVYYGGVDNEVQADSDGWAVEVHEKWTGFGLTSDQADQVVTAKRPFRESSGASSDKETGIVLGLLKDFGHLERYCNQRGLSLEEAEALIKRAR